MRYLSLCSGIEAASVAWHPLGFTPVAFSEFEAFPSAVLAHHYPNVPNLGDMTKFKEWKIEPIDLLVGGTPCQSFSVAGLRKGLADPRGNLMLTYLAIAAKFRPKWLVWENVPGVLSSNGGRDFGTFLAGLGELGYGFAYRVLDAQYVRVESHPRAVPQRRRRVFVVGCLGDWRRAAAVLFERESLCGHPPPRREAGQRIAACTAPSLTASGRGVERTGESRGQDPVIAVPATVGALRDGAHMGGGFDVAHSLKAEGFDASEDGTGRGTPLVPTFAIQGAATRENPASGPDGVGVRSDGLAYTLEARAEVQYIAFGTKDHGADAQVDLSPTLRAGGHSGSHANAGVMPAVAFIQGENNAELGNRTSEARDAWSNTENERRVRQSPMAVRRLLPIECERLQGFPDGWTDVPYRGKSAADGPRYKALGNSMAVNVMRWVGGRIKTVEVAGDGE